MAGHARQLLDCGVTDALGLANTTGQLAAGLAADLLVLAGNPLQDLAALGRLESVVAAGRLHRPAPALPID